VNSPEASEASPMWFPSDSYVIPILGKAPHPPKGEGLKIVLQAIDNQKGKAKGIHLNFIINLLSPYKKQNKTI